MTPHFVITLGDVVGSIAILGCVSLFLCAHSFEAIDDYRERRRRQKQIKLEMDRAAKRAREPWTKGDAGFHTTKDDPWP